MNDLYTEYARLCISGEKLSADKSIQMANLVAQDILNIQVSPLSPSYLVVRSQLVSRFSDQDFLKKCLAWVGLEESPSAMKFLRDWGPTLGIYACMTEPPEVGLFTRDIMCAVFAITGSMQLPSPQSKPQGAHESVKTAAFSTLQSGIEAPLTGKVLISKVGKLELEVFLDFSRRVMYSYREHLEAEVYKNSDFDEFEAYLLWLSEEPNPLWRQRHNTDNSDSTCVHISINTLEGLCKWINLICRYVTQMLYRRLPVVTVLPIVNELLGLEKLVHQKCFAELKGNSAFSKLMEELSTFADAVSDSQRVSESSTKVLRTVLQNALDSTNKSIKNFEEYSQTYTATVELQERLSDNTLSLMTLYKCLEGLLDYMFVVCKFTQINREHFVKMCEDCFVILGVLPYIRFSNVPIQESTYYQTREVCRYLLTSEKS